MDQILGIHHITAIAGDAKRNYDFYTRVLGLRFVKKTVNFDDPGTYHFYFGDEHGTPGTILTFFPWQGVTRGKQGNGMATEVVYAVNADSLVFWNRRLRDHGVSVTREGTRLGEPFLSFEDPDGLPLTLLERQTSDPRQGWTAHGVDQRFALKGFSGIDLSLTRTSATASVLTDILGYHLVAREGERYRYTTDAVSGASVVDLLERPAGRRGVNAGGTVHHVAFRVKNEDILMRFREKVLAHGLSITPKIDRNYFFSLYFREPGGVLFEIATDNPGFEVDESPESLGEALKLPAQYEDQRSEIEKILPPLS